MAGGLPWPPITVVTPVFNGAAWIAETVESVLAQDYPGELEYIVLDDGSVDATLDVLAAFAQRGLRIVSHGNMGEARTVNRGAELASHDLFAVVNADDPVLPGWAQAMAEAFVADPDLSGAYPDWRRIDASGRVIGEVRTREFDYAVLFAQHFCLPGPGAVLRRSHLRGEMVRDPARGTSSDYDLWLRLGLHGRLRRVPRVLATWRRHAAGTSSAARGRAMATDKIGTIRSLLARSDLPPNVRDLGPMAMSAAYLNAALLGLRASDIPSLRYAVMSYWYKPIWPPVERPQRRSLPHLAYAAAQPLSGWLHAQISPWLPRPFSRSAVLTDRFGRSDA
jgi:glycosyltransferase involved in cell wall biosynthesis